MTERNNIEIDYCPTCRGIWLDRGELDKMLEYAEQKYKNAKEEKYNGQQQYPKYDNDHYKYNPQYHQKPHKKKGFLGDIFDFD